MSERDEEALDYEYYEDSYADDEGSYEDDYSEFQEFGTEDEYLDITNSEQHKSEEKQMGYDKDCPRCGRKTNSMVTSSTGEVRCRECYSLEGERNKCQRCGQGDIQLSKHKNLWLCQNCAKGERDGSAPKPPPPVITPTYLRETITVGRRKMTRWKAWRRKDPILTRAISLSVKGIMAGATAGWSAKVILPFGLMDALMGGDFKLDTVSVCLNSKIYGTIFWGFFLKALIANQIKLQALDAKFKAGGGK
ncbi:MAG: hypothetical protein FWE31_04395 [Firmicutes bacterium]|nr:hypothetical protein [Bacillota bacterium]